MGAGSPTLARERHTQGAPKYSAYWEQVRRMPVWTGRQNAGLAGKSIESSTKKCRDYDRRLWAANHGAARRWRLSMAPGDYVDSQNPMPQEADIRETLERDAGAALDELKRSGMVVSDVVREGLLRHAGRAVLKTMERISRECDDDYGKDPNEDRFPEFVPLKDLTARSPLAEFVFEAALKGWKPAIVDK